MDQNELQQKLPDGMSKWLRDEVSVSLLSALEPDENVLLTDLTKPGTVVSACLLLSLALTFFIIGFTFQNPALVLLSLLFAGTGTMFLTSTDLFIHVWILTDKHLIRAQRRELERWPLTDIQLISEFPNVIQFVERNSSDITIDMGLLHSPRFMLEKLNGLLAKPRPLCGSVTNESQKSFPAPSPNSVPLNDAPPAIPLAPVKTESKNGPIAKTKLVVALTEKQLDQIAVARSARWSRWMAVTLGGCGGASLYLNTVAAGLKTAHVAGVSIRLYELSYIATGVVLGFLTYWLVRLSIKLAKIEENHRLEKEAKSSAGE